MTNIKITKDAREAAASIAEWQASTGWKPCFFVPEFAGKAQEGVRDNHPLVEMMQALINQTVDRCAKVADDYEGTAANDRCDDPQGAAACDIGDAIRTLKDN